LQVCGWSAAFVVPLSTFPFSNWFHYERMSLGLLAPRERYMPCPFLLVVAVRTVVEGMVEYDLVHLMYLHAEHVAFQWFERVGLLLAANNTTFERCSVI
jgi:hypothetical protein